MRFQRIRIENYRNYAACEFHIEKRITALIGNNGQGKTNFLEAVSFLGSLSSFRTADWKHCVKNGSTLSRLNADFVTDQRAPYEMEITLESPRKKKQFLNGKQVRPADLYGKADVVSFCPMDHMLIRGSATYRRDFIDSVCESTSPTHKENSAQLSKILQQRSSVLKAENQDLDQYLLWTERLIEVSPKIIAKRIETLTELMPKAALIYERLSQGSEEISVRYHDARYDGMTQEEIKEVLEGKFAEKAAIEKMIARNLIGPQLEDIHFFIDGLDARETASQGQSRSLILALKLATAELIEERWAVNPVFIADDIASELDEQRRYFLLDYLEKKNTQIFLSAADLRFVPKNSADCHVVYVNDGHLEKMNDRTTAHI